MINCTRLLSDKPGSWDEIRYQPGKPADTNRPIVVWNSTRRCNLKCIHCYIDAKKAPDIGELSTEEAKILIDDLAAFGAPVFLFSGGEPFMREDLFQLGSYAKDQGLRTVISTNGTLITNDLARKVKAAGFSYVGISLDGLEATNDKFREQKGAFRKALSGIRNCLKSGVRVGLRFTINKYNFREVPGIFDLIKTEGIPRACFYHLVYSGRGSALINDDLTPPEARDTMDLIFACSQELSASNTEILTVDNHADGVYLYLQLKKVNPKKAQSVLELLKINGGNKSGIGIADVDNLGNVHPDQFWREHTFGNVKERKFSEIWMDQNNELLRNLRNRLPLLKGKCGRCNFKDICGGNFRARAESLYGDIWQEDPACYLTEEEISQKA